MKNNVEKNKTALLEEFNSLNTLKKKLDFWEAKLGMNYILYLEDFENLETLKEFQIVDGFNKLVDSKPCWEEFNQWILDNFKANTQKGDIIFLDFLALKKEFNDELKTVKNKLESVNRAIKEVDESFKHMPSGSYVSPPLVLPEIWNFKFNANYKAYTDFLNYSISPDYSSLFPGLHIIKYANGKTLAEYRIYLNSLQKKYSSKTPNSNAGKELSNKQISLLLHYTDAKKPTTEIIVYARIISGLLDTHYKELYDDLREPIACKNKKNIQAVWDFMDANDLTPPKELLFDLNKYK